MEKLTDVKYELLKLSVQVLTIRVWEINVI